MSSLRHPRPVFASAALLAVLLGACSPAPERPNVVLISIDSLRADHLGSYGYPRTTSPSIDALASESVLFERAYSTSSWTLPAHLSMLSSLYPEQHGVVDNALALGAGAELLSEVLSASGYRSAAVVSGPYLDRSWGFDQGWERYDDRLAVAAGPDQRSRSHRVVNSEQVHAELLRRLDELGAGPYFLFVHYWDVHYDYIPPPPFDAMFDPEYSGSMTGESFEGDPWIHSGMDPRDLQHLVALYDGEIRWVDSWIGELLAELRRRGTLDRSVVVLTADHGDEFFEHGEKGHQKNLFEPVLRVPLVVRLPRGRSGGTRIGTPASLVDVAPTLAELVGVPAPSSWSGRALFARGAVAAPGPLFADLFGRRKALVRGPWKLLAGPAGAAGELRVRGLFDLSSDPGEQENLKRIRTEIAATMFGELTAAQARFAADRAGHPPRPRQADEALEQQLRALGYL